MHLAMLYPTVFLLTATPLLGFEHKIDLWEDIDFTGVGITVINRKKGPGSLEYCNNLGSEWWNRISSIRTFGNCYEIYDDLNCRGEVLYLYPGSRSHNRLTDLGWNDRPKSFRLCDLDESYVGDGLQRRSLKPGRPELPFWQYVFGLIGGQMLREFNERSRNSWFISWDFIPGIRGSPSRTYQYALEWLQGYVRGGNFDEGQLRQLQRRAQQVVDDRAQLNQQHAGNSRSQAIHVQIENIWRELLDVITTTADNTNDFNDYL